jgi:endonuclease/exonuclease/phosphatase family metal-dependent hydrolase
MSRFAALALALIVPVGCVPGGDARDAGLGGDDTTLVYIQPGEVRIATFNAEFLFDGMEPDGGADFPWKNNPRAATAHRRAVSRIVRSLNADIVVLTEVEHLGVLDSMATIDLEGLAYSSHLIEGRDSFTRQDVGLLSRLPIDRTFRSNERAPTGLGSDTYGVAKHLVARFTIDGLPITLIAVHLLAQAENPSRRPLREAQAEVVRRQVVREIAAGRQVIVAGDFNDYDGSVPDAAGSRPVTTALATIRRAGPGATDDLFNALALEPQETRYTVGRDTDRDGRLERHEVAAIDHVLMSPALRARLLAVRVAHSPEARAASDHVPVVVTLRRGRAAGRAAAPGSN